VLLGNLQSSNYKSLVEMKGITKSFYGIRANDEVNFEVRPGEIHTLLGENGAGKSTLMNILCGLYTPERGTIKVNGEKWVFKSPKDAINAGIGMLHQHFMLVPVMTVWENVALGDEELPQVLPKNKVIERIKELSDVYGLSVNPLAPVWQLSVGEQQRVAIVKLLYRQAKILILDEPTAVLTPLEARYLFKVIRKMAEEGHGIVFISHKLDEVLEISDRITVLRKGRNVGTVAKEEASKEKLAEMMIGKRIAFAIDKSIQNPGKKVLNVKNIKVLGDRGRLKVNDISFSLRQREILGIAGVSGNGQEELAEALTGLRKPISGKVFVDGDDVTSGNPRDFMKRRVSYIPADRKGTGLIANMNLRENIALRKYWKSEYTRFKFFVNWERIAGHTGRLVERFNVANPSLSYPVRLLSGGNMQKLMLARELSDNPRVIIAVQPTWGLDIGATHYVREVLISQKEKGSGVLLITDDLEEILALSDRIAVIHGGEIVGIVDNPDKVTEEELGLMMAGTKLEKYPVYDLKEDELK